MSTFIDSNVAVGYTIIHDKWHVQAKEIIDETQDPVFWSNLVKKESKTKSILS